MQKVVHDVICMQIVLLDDNFILIKEQQNRSTLINSEVPV